MSRLSPIIYIVLFSLILVVTVSCGTNSPEQIKESLKPQGFDEPWQGLPSEEGFPGFNEGRKMLEERQGLETDDLHDQVDIDLNRWQKGEKDIPFVEEMTLFGSLGILEGRKDLDKERFLLEEKMLDAFLAEWETLEKLRPLPDCGLILAMASAQPPLPLSSQTLAQCQAQYTLIPLTNGLILPAIEGDSSIQPIVLQLPVRLNHYASEANFNVEISQGNLPEARLRWYPAFTQNFDAFVIDNHHRGDKSVAKWSRTKTFSIRLWRCLNAQRQPVTCTALNQESYEYELTLPVNLGVHEEFSTRHGATLLWDVAPGHEINEILYASGDEVNSSGDFTWHWQGTLPHGLSESLVFSHTDQNFQFGGQIQEGALSSQGQISLEQNGNSVARDAIIRVPIHFLPSATDVLNETHKLTPGQAFELILPEPRGGGDGQYQWLISGGSNTLSALGLQLSVSGIQSKIHGLVPVNAVLGKSQVGLEIRSNLAPNVRFNLDFDVSIPFSVWTQNAQLRPNNLVNLSTAEAAALAAVAPTLAAHLGVAEGIYDLTVGNTAEDNEERTNLILNHHIQFDIVGLQEVFDEDNLTQLLAGTSYQSSQGPGSIGPSFNPLNPKLPEGSSGLVLLLNNRITRTFIVAPVFNACDGDLLDVIAGIVTLGDLNSDCLAQKGFITERLQFGSDPNAYLYVINTHLDAGDSAGDASARGAQLAQIRSVMNTLDLDHPILIMGDLNVTGESPANTPTAEFLAMLTTLGVTDLFRSQFPTGVSGFTFDNQINAYAYHWSDGENQMSRKRLDYFLVRQGNKYKIELDTKGIRIQSDNRTTASFMTRKCRRQENGHSEGWLIEKISLRCSVSDHWGLEAHLRLVKP